MTENDGIWLGGVGMDVFGEAHAARVVMNDPNNNKLRNYFLTKYLQHHRQNCKLYDNFESDLFRLKMLWYQKWALTFASVAFAAIVINPNFT